MTISGTDYGLKRGKAELRSVGPIAFGPDDVLFVADTLGAAIFADHPELPLAVSSGRQCSLRRGTFSDRHMLCCRESIDQVKDTSLCFHRRVWRFLARQWAISLRVRCQACW